MSDRTDLGDILKAILGNTTGVYFQPPPTVSMVYPCIVYEWSNADTQFANNSPYLFKKRYMITVIAKDPDSDLPDKIAALPMCLFDRRFTKDNLNHSVFNIYF